MAEACGWRAPFFVFAIPTVVLVLLGARLKEPRPRRAGAEGEGADAATADTEEEPPSFAEGWRMCWQIDSLRRIYRDAAVPHARHRRLRLFAVFMYGDVFGLDDSGRGWVVGLVEGPSQLVGLTVGARLGMRLFAKDPSSSSGSSPRSIFIATAGGARVRLGAEHLRRRRRQRRDHRLPGLHAAGLLAALSVAIPPRARSMGFSMASVFVLPGLLTLPVIGAHRRRPGASGGA